MLFPFIFSPFLGWERLNRILYPLTIIIFIISFYYWMGCEDFFFFPFALANQSTTSYSCFLNSYDGVGCEGEILTSFSSAKYWLGV